MQLYAVHYISVNCSLYMFRVVSPPIIRSTYNCNHSIWHWSNRLYYLPLSWSGWDCRASSLRKYNKLYLVASCWTIIGIRYRLHKSPLLVPVPSLINSDYAPLPCFFQMHFNIILQRTFWSCKWCITCRLHYQYIVFLFTPVHAT